MKKENSSERNSRGSQFVIELAASVPPPPPRCPPPPLLRPHDTPPKRHTAVIIRLERRLKLRRFAGHDEDLFIFYFYIFLRVRKLPEDGKKTTRLRQRSPPLAYPEPRWEARSRRRDAQVAFPEAGHGTKHEWRVEELFRVATPGERRRRRASKRERALLSRMRLALLCEAKAVNFQLCIRAGRRDLAQVKEGGVLRTRHGLPMLLARPSAF